MHTLHRHIRLILIPILYQQLLSIHIIYLILIEVQYNAVYQLPWQFNHSRFAGLYLVSMSQQAVGNLYTTLHCQIEVTWQPQSHQE